MKKSIDEAGVTVRLYPIAELTPNPRNARIHPTDQVDQIAASMVEFGFTNPILADIDDGGIIVAGHGRRLAALKVMADGGTIRLPNGRALPAGMIPVIDCTGWTEAQRRAYTLADNRLAETSTWDDDLLRLEFEFLAEENFDVSLTGWDSSEIDKMLAGADAPTDASSPEEARATLAERFGIAPFSVMNAREGWWQDRKRAWLALGIQSEVGRGENLIGRSLHDRVSQILRLHYSQIGPFIEKLRAEGKTEAEIEAAAHVQAGTVGGGKAKNGKRKAATFGQDIMRGEHVVGESDQPGNPASSGTSIFDPVLCELSYRWFCPPGGVILDPFAGGSVRGIVASVLGRQYVGGELRAEQVAANRDQAEKLCSDPVPVWNVGDSRRIQETCEGTEADFIFSCPPYADLEVYSDDPQDISTLAYKEFRAAYFEIIAATCAMLKPNRFAAFVVGEVRDKKGNYYGFVPDTIEAFRAAGLEFYNEAILVTAAGSLPIRAGKQFDASRKLGKTHQNILVFVKGDAKLAVEAIGKVEFGAIGFEEDFDPEEGERRPPLEDFTPALTPIEKAGDIFIKRDDLWTIAGVPGGKVRTCWHLSQGAKGLVTAGSRSSPQVNIVAHIAQRLGIPCRAHVPTGELSPEVKAASEAGAEIIQHNPGYNTVIVARARDDADALGWTEIPFGMECEEAVKQTSSQVGEIPEGVRRIVIPVGSGMSFCGVLHGLARAKIDIPVLGVVVGADPMKRIKKYAPVHWESMARLVPAGVDYHVAVDASVGGVKLDPHYEAKCARFLEPGDMLWVVGIRASEH